MSLRNKILLLFLSLLIISSVATIGAVLLATNNDVKLQAQEKLSVGEKVFQRLLQERGNQLRSSASVLVADFGFKEAVTSEDVGTIRSALENNSERIDADLMMLIDLDGVLITSVSDSKMNQRQYPFQELLSTARDNNGLSAILLMDGRIYQTVMLPIKAPITIAWTVIGIHIDAEFAGQLAGLTDLEVVFWGEDETSERSQVATLPITQLPATSSRSMESTSLSSMQEDKHEYLLLQVPLANSKKFKVGAILLASLDEAYARYSPLKLQILVIAAITLLLSLIATFVISGNVTRPIANLVAAATRISDGNYLEAIDVNKDEGEEIAALGSSLQIMQQGIAEREQRLSQQAYHDSLTGLGNRLFLLGQLEQLIGSGESNGFALLRISVNDFDQINDTFGYQIGDNLLVKLAARLLEFAGDSNRVARVNPDEFALLVKTAEANEVEAQLKALASLMQQPISLDDVSLKISPSTGVVFFPQHADEAEQLLRRSDIALNLAKYGKLSQSVYQPGQDESHMRKIVLVKDLKLALEDDLLQLHYQPKVDLHSGKVSQAEALLRWTHAELGFISPEEFITLAEQAGLMPMLTRWVLRSVFSQAKKWHQGGINVAIAVNLSAYDLHPDFPGQLEELINESAVAADRIILEITESAVMVDADTAIKVLHSLRQLGFKLSIDDYGTGYSSLAKLKDLPVDELKIDKSFVMQLEANESDRIIVSSTIELAHNMGLSVVAEGVETLGACHLLEQWKCDKLQGYYFSKALPAADFEVWLGAYEEENNVERDVG